MSISSKDTLFVGYQVRNDLSSAGATVTLDMNMHAGGTPQSLHSVYHHLAATGSGNKFQLPTCCWGATLIVLSLWIVLEDAFKTDFKNP